MDPNYLTGTSTTSSTATSGPKSTNSALPGPSNDLPVAAKAGIGVGACAFVAASIIGLFLLCRRRQKSKRHASTVNGQNRMSMHEMNGDNFPEVREMDATEPPVELQAAPVSLHETTDSSSELLASPLSGTLLELPVYPRQQIDEHQEPKSLNQVLENGGLEPKSLSTPQERPRRPVGVHPRPP